jgi:hypothetical protein
VIDPSLLADATAAVMGDRQDSYGNPEDNLGRIAQLWGAWIGKDLSAHDVAVLMALVKISRASHTHHRDNYVDGIGYLALAERLGRPWM